MYISVPTNLAWLCMILLRIHKIISVHRKIISDPSKILSDSSKILSDPSKIFSDQVGTLLLFMQELIEATESWSEAIPITDTHICHSRDSHPSFCKWLSLKIWCFIPLPRQIMDVSLNQYPGSSLYVHLMEAQTTSHCNRFIE